MTRSVTALGLFPVAADVVMAEFLASRNLVFVIVFLVFVDLILLASFISAISRRDPEIFKYQEKPDSSSRTRDH